MSSAQALDLNGQKISPITLEPGKELINHYIITGTERNVEVKIGGDLQEFISLTPVINNEFNLVIKAPEKLPEPGKYYFSLSATEVPEKDQPVLGSLISINLRFEVIVPPHGKSLSLSLEAKNVNEKEPVIFTVNIANNGLETINALSGKINVYDLSNKTVGNVTLLETSLLSLQSKELKAQMDTNSLPPANYWAEAIITYDGMEKRASDSFKIGNLDLLLKSYTSELEPGFAEFKALVENNWGNRINNIYAKLYINEQELLHTPTIYLDPWESGSLEGIIKVDFPPGDYDAKLILFFEGQSKEENLNIKIKGSAEAQSGAATGVVAGNATFLAILIVGIIIIVVLALLLLLVWKKGNKKFNDENK